MHWNNAGNYDMLSADVDETEPFIGTCPEAGREFKKPAFGKTVAPAYRDEGLSWMDRVYHHGENGPDRGVPAMETAYNPLLQVNINNSK